VLSPNWPAGLVLQHEVCPTIPILLVGTLSIPGLWFCRAPGSQTTGLGLDGRRCLPFATVVSAPQHLDDFSTSTRILVGARCVSVGRTLGRAIEPFWWVVYFHRANAMPRHLNARPQYGNPRPLNALRRAIRCGRGRPVHRLLCIGAEILGQSATLGDMIIAWLEISLIVQPRSVQCVMRVECRGRSCEIPWSLSNAIVRSLCVQSSLKRRARRGMQGLSVLRPSSKVSPPPSVPRLGWRHRQIRNSHNPR
jgi:hypothetical protein